MTPKSDKELLHELNELNTKVRNELLLTMVISGTIGFFIGMIVASIFHKVIVHPLGY